MSLHLTSRGKKGRGDHGLYPSLLGRGRSVAIVTPISPPEGRREGVTMASTLLFLGSGWGVIIVTPISPPEGRREGVTMASTLLFLEGGGSLLGKWRSVIIVTRSHFQREEGKRRPWPLPFFSWEVEVCFTSLLAKLMGCDHCHSILPSEGSREGVTMASTLLFLEGGGSLLEKWRSVIIVTPSHFQREEGKR